MKSILTAPQKNMYDTHNFFENTAISNVGGCVFFKEEIDVETIKNAINKLLETSDGMRIRLVQEDGNVYQVISDYAVENIDVLNFSQNNYQIELEKDMSIPFDLNDKLYSFKVICVDGKFGVYMKLHHIISDAWSAALIASKLSEYCLEGTEKVDENLSYVNFIKNEEDYANSKKYIKDKEYWASKYDVKPSLVTMSPGKSSDFDVAAFRKSFDIPTDVSTDILNYCESNGLSLAVLFEAVVSLCATRINNVDDVTLCSMVVNRNGYEEKNTVGMFNNILPLTVNIVGDKSFLELCRDISTEHFQLFRHQKYPFSDILNLIGNGDISPVYDIMVSYQNAEFEMSSIESVEWIFNGTSDLGFMVNISENKDDKHIHLDFDCRKNLFSEYEVELIYNRLVAVILSVIGNVEIKINEIEIITESEKEQILRDFNDTYKDYPREKLIYSYLEENAKLHPEKIALDFEGKQLSYAEFNKKANVLAHYIVNNIDKHNPVIGVISERSLEMMIAIYASLKAGCSYMPIDPHFPKDRIGFMIKDSGTPLVLSQSQWLNIIQNDVKTVNISDFDYSEYSCEDLQLDISSDDTAYVIYTSGSTGKPKGAMIAHHSVINRIKWMHEKYPLNENGVILQKTPYTFDVSVWELFWWSMYGGTLKILIPEGHKDPFEIIKAVKDSSVTHMHFVPSMLNAFLEYVEVNPKCIDDLKSLRYVFASGEALQANHVKKFYNLLKDNGTTLHNLYGPTECTVDVSYYDCDPENIPQTIPIGKPIDNTQLIVLDKFGKLLPCGVVGELHIGGVGVCKGYLNRDELTKEKFVPNPYYGNAVMYKSGDLARFLPDGNIEYFGRTDFQIKIRGLRVELGDIENAISKYLGIKQVFVTVFDIKGEKNLCAYITAHQTVDTNRLQEFLKDYLPEYMIPQYYVQVEEFPTTNNGKIDRKALPQPNIETIHREYVAPANNMEALIQKYVMQVLETEEISCAESLFDYGLTSLGVISIITDLSIEGFEFKVKSFYEHRTIQAIVKSYYDGGADDDYEEDRLYYSDISDISNYSLPEKQGNAVMLTGASGFLGVHIIDELIKNTDKKIYCLVRREKKLEDAVKEYTNITYPNERIIAVKGDITLPDLGIAEEYLSAINDDVTDIIHSAADVTFFCAWERSKLINYTGTCNVLELAEKIGAKLHHISTMSVSGDLLTRQTVERPEFAENNLFIGQKYKDNVYAHSKYLAEKEIVKAIRNGKVNASIYRIANLTWRASDGKFQSNYLNNDLYIMTSVMKNLNKIPAELAEENLALTPVDDCARAIVTLMQNKTNSVYHLYSDHSLGVRDYMESITDCSSIPLEEFCGILRRQTDSFSQFVFAYIIGLLDNGDDAIVFFKKVNSCSALKTLHFSWNELGCLYAQTIKKLL